MAEFASESFELVSDGFLLDWRHRSVGEYAQVIAAGFELEDRVVLDFLSVEFGERSFLACVEVWGELAELVFRPAVVAVA